MIDFIVNTPFWKAFWFWFLIAMCLQLFTIYYVSKWQKKKKEKKLAREIANVQTASLEQQAFTSLMNPHFIFNALNSIQYYINVQDRQNVNRYLSDFASLIRKSFEAAQQYFIPLEQELEIVKIYLRLEKMRFSGRFTYKIVMDDKLDPEQWMIPTMLLQPLLENALLHGIMPSTINGDILLELSLFQNNLCIVITDNGIGIEKSRILKKSQSHKSHGMDLIRKRIAALNHFGESPIILQMTPAFEDDKNPGNRITIIIPAKLHSVWLKAQRY
jgi:LytS/YehU family sensor histidine kinase